MSLTHSALHDDPGGKVSDLIQPGSIESFSKPDPKLLEYYFWRSLLFGPFFPIAFYFSYRRYTSLTYRLELKRISASWGYLAFKDVSIGYERVQDIHLRRNFIERRLGLARLEIQTASGESKAEIVLEGCLRFEELRQLLFQRVQQLQKGGLEKQDEAVEASAHGELVQVFREVAQEIKGLRLGIAKQAPTELSTVQAALAPTSSEDIHHEDT